MSRAKYEEAADLVARSSSQLADATIRWAELIERVSARADEHSKTMKGFLDFERSRYADLMASYRMLRLQGFTAPPVEPTREAKPVDAVLDTVNKHARDAKTKTAMLAQVAIDRAAKLTDVEIIQRIERGNRPMDEVA